MSSQRPLVAAVHSIAFSVDFVAGKARPRFTQRGSVYTPKATTLHEMEIADAYRAACDAKGHGVLKAKTGTKVSVVVECYTPVPKSTAKHVSRIPYTKKPDVDNVLKLVLDGLNGVAYEDDKQVVHTAVFKYDQERDTRHHMRVHVVMEDAWETFEHQD